MTVDAAAPQPARIGVRRRRVARASSPGSVLPEAGSPMAMGVAPVAGSGDDGGRQHPTALVVDRSSLGQPLDRPPRALPTSIEVLLADPQLTASERADWRSRLAELYEDCGCGAGAVGLLSSIPVLVGLFLLGPGEAGPLEPRGLAMVVGLPVSGAVGGKLFGLMRRRRRLRKAIAELAALIDERHQREHWTCAGG